MTPAVAPAVSTDKSPGSFEDESPGQVVRSLFAEVWELVTNPREVLSDWEGVKWAVLLLGLILGLFAFASAVVAGVGLAGWCCYGAVCVLHTGPEARLFDLAVQVTLYLIGCLLLTLRESNRTFYGTIETVFGMGLGLIAVYSEGELWKILVLLLTSSYIVVRGLDNSQEGEKASEQEKHRRRILASLDAASVTLSPLEVAAIRAIDSVPLLELAADAMENATDLGEAVRLVLPLRVGDGCRIDDAIARLDLRHRKLIEGGKSS